MYEFTGDSRDSRGLPTGYLTETSRFRLEYLPVPVELSHHVTTFYHYCCDDLDIRDIQPAAVGHLAIFPRGEGAIQFHDGHDEPIRGTNLLTPLSVATPFTVSGPFHAIGAALTPLGWAELTGLGAGEHANHFYRAGDWLGEEVMELGAEWCEAYRQGTMSGAECARAMAQFIAGKIVPLPDQHRQMIGQTTMWLMGSLDPDIEELYATLAFSRRQSQRLVERFFGLTPTALRRKYRALRAAAILSQPDCTDEAAEAVLDAFYDQSHMIREIRLFSGRTPARLSAEPDSYLTEMLDLRNLRELIPPRRERLATS
jgi:AraC-like DNA-binding protein